MKTIQEKSLSTLVKELAIVRQDIAFSKRFIHNLNKNRVWVGLDKNGYKELTESEIKNDKPRWLKNNKISLKDSLKLEKEYLLAIRKKAK